MTLTSNLLPSHSFHLAIIDDNEAYSNLLLNILKDKKLVISTFTTPLHFLKNYSPSTVFDYIILDYIFFEIPIKTESIIELSKTVSRKLFLFCGNLKLIPSDIINLKLNHIDFVILEKNKKNIDSIFIELSH